ncbi:hypothetical protein Tco_0084787 [Tanacetum coccineum]
MFWQLIHKENALGLNVPNLLYNDVQHFVYWNCVLMRFMIDLVGSRLYKCIFDYLVIRGWSGLPPFQYQPSRNEKVDRNELISVRNEQNLLWRDYEWVKKGCALLSLGPWLTCLSLSESSLLSPIDYAFDRFLPKVVWKGFFLLTHCPYNSFSFFNPFNVIPKRPHYHLVGIVPVITHALDNILPDLTLLLFSIIPRTSTLSRGKFLGRSLRFWLDHGNRNFS